MKRGLKMRNKNTAENFSSSAPSCGLSVFFRYVFSAAFGLCRICRKRYLRCEADREIKIELDGKKSLSEIAQLFEAGGVIGNSYFFELYARKKGAEANLTAYSGEILLNSKMSYREIILEFF